MIALVNTPSYAANLECARCGKFYSLQDSRGFAPCCQQPLLVNYDYPAGFYREDLPYRVNSMWRYFEMLPLAERRHIVSMGEGMTPLLPLTRLAARFGASDIWIKDESGNPTGSFKARGISMAVSMARERGTGRAIIPTAGNAGGAMAAYCARAGIECTVVMPRHTPDIFKAETRQYGAELILVAGLINDCARKVAELKAVKEYADFSTLREPFRLEGKKTLGFEIAEQLDWQLPDWIVYPAGGGTGLIGIWKALREMKRMGWIQGPLPRMLAVQSSQCDPIVRAYRQPRGWESGFLPAPSRAHGLAVPFPFGMDLVQKVLHESGGLALAVSDGEILEGMQEVARAEGLLISPEGAAAWKGLEALRRNNLWKEGETVVLLNTGSGYKYLENLENDRS